MASIIVGNDLGVQNSSLNKIGANNLDGLGTSGKTGEQVFVNAATGNLVIQNVDENLVGAGIDSIAVRTYNQFGQWNGTSFDNWRIGFYRRVYNLTGTANTVGSTVTKTNADGSESLYTYDATTGKYVTTEGAGAHQTLTYDDANDAWTWSDAQGDVSETYTGKNGYWKIVSSETRAGEVTNYIYDWEGNLIRLEDSSGQRLNLAYDDETGLLDAITVFYGDGWGHYTTRYYYDRYDRLERVVVDLSPENFSIGDANTYTTTYTYDGASDRIASISQTDGTHVSFTYERSGRDYKVRTMTDAQGDISVFTYSEGSTNVQDSLGNITTFHYDAQNRLIKVEQPSIGGVRSTVEYEYNDLNDADNITRIIDANGNEVVYQYDANGNQIYQRDQLGNVIERTYNANSQLETETVYLVADPDGDGTGQPQDPQTSRYVYYPSGYLAYSIDAEGGVSKNEWDNATGNLEVATQFTQNRYDISQLGNSETPTSTQMDSWVANHADKSQAIKTEYTYDFRGQVASSTIWSDLDNLGNGIPGTESTTYYVYDAKGRLLKTVDPRAASAADEAYASHITYDGLGRVLSTTNAADAVTTTVYDDANNKVIVTSASGLITTSTYNAGGELISVTQAGDGQSYATTSYEYDAAGNLIKETDTDGNETKNIYDTQNRLVATFDAEGYLTEIKYDIAGNVIETIKYESKIDGTYFDQYGEQLVNTTTYDNQSRPRLTKLTNGNYVVTWYSTNGVNSWDVMAQLMDQNGKKIGDELTINQVVEGGQYTQSVESLAGGGFVVAWSDGRNGDWDVYYRVFDESGTEISNDRIVSTFSDDYQKNPSITGLDNGDFVIVWHSRSNADDDTSSYGVYARRFDSYGNPQGAEQRVNTVTADNQYAQSIETLAGGRYVITWRSDNQVGEFGEVWGQVYDENSQKIGSEFHVNTITTDVQKSSSIVALSDGNFIVTWSDHSSGSWDIKARLYNSSGVAQGDEYLINTYTNNSQFASRCAQLTDDTLIYVWEDTDNDGDSYGVFAQRMTTAGEKIGSEFRINQTPNGSQRDQDIIALDDGKFAVAWGSTGQQDDDSEGGIVIRHFLLDEFTTLLSENNIRTRHIYDDAGRLVYTIDGEGYVSENVYDGSGQLIEIRRFEEQIYSIEELENLSGGVVTETQTNTVLLWDQNLDTNSDGFGLVGSAVYSNNAIEMGSKYAFIGDSLQAFFASENGHVPGAEPLIYHASVSTDSSQQGTFEYGIRTLISDTEERYSVHSAVFTNGKIYGKFDNDLGDAALFELTEDFATYNPNTEYEVEFEVLSNQSILYVYEKGTDRDNGFIHTLDMDHIGETSFYGMGWKEGWGVDSKIYLNEYAEYAIEEQTVVRNGPLSAHASEKLIYDGAGRLIYTIDAEGYVSETVYNAAGQTVETKSYDTAYTGTVYTEAALEAADLGDSLSTYMVYDDAGRLVYTIDNNGQVTKTEYDAAGNATKTIQYSDAIDPSAVSTLEEVQNAITISTKDRIAQARYNELGLVTEQLSGVGNSKIEQGEDEATIWNQYSTRYEYDAMGRRISATDANGYQTLFFYDARGLQTHTVKVLNGQNQGEVVETIYNAFGDIEETIVYANTIDTSGLIGGSVNATLENRLTSAASSEDTHTQFEYSARGQLTKTIDALNNEVRSTYNAFGQLEQSIDQTGTITQFEYDKLGNVIKTIDDLNGKHISTTIKYDAFGRVIETTDAHGNVTKLEYDKLGQVIVTEDALGNDTIMTYDAFGRVLTQTDALGYTTTYTYDDENNSVTITNAEGFSSTTISNEFGEQDSITDAKGNQTTFEYNHDGQLTKVIDAQGNESETIYDQGGRTFQAVDANGTVTELEYDSANRLFKRILDKGGIEQTTTYGYDHKGQAVSVEDNNGIVTKTIYNQLGQVEQVIADEGGLNIITAYSYDEKGNQVSVTEAQGTGQERTTQFIYDELNRLTDTVIADGTVTKTIYNELGQVEQVIADEGGLNIITAYSYDANGNQLSVTEAQGTAQERITQFVYDDLNRLTDTIAADGTVTKTIYDSLGQVEQVIQDAGDLNIITAYSYDANGNQISATAAQGTGQERITNIVYDALNRVIFAVDAEGYVTENQYNALGQIDLTKSYKASYTGAEFTKDAIESAMSGVESVEQRFIYDNLGRVRFTIDAEGYVSENEYNALGQVETTKRYDTAYPGTVYTETALESVMSGISCIEQHFVYNSLGQLRFTVDALGNVSENEYDALGQVEATKRFESVYTGTVFTEAALESELSGVKSVEQRFVYDALGRVLFTIDAEGYVTENQYNTLGQVEMTKRYTTVYTGTIFTADALEAALSEESSIDQRYIYNELGQARFTIDAQGHVSENEYDAVGNVITTKRFGNVYFGTIFTDQALEAFYADKDSID
ncbi:MAG: RHS repeat protein, partial [Gammaproteobacteria bacterium]